VFHQFHNGAVKSGAHGVVRSSQQGRPRKYVKMGHACGSDVADMPIGDGNDGGSGGDAMPSSCS